MFGLENGFVEARASKNARIAIILLLVPLLLWGLFSIRIALPSAPGYVGVCQMAVVWAFSIYEVPTALAVAMTTVFQLAIILAAASMSLIYYFQAIHHKFSSCLE